MTEGRSGMAAAMQASQARKRLPAGERLLTRGGETGGVRRSKITRDGDKFVIPDALLEDMPNLKAFVQKHVRGLEYDVVLDAWVI